MLLNKLVATVMVTKGKSDDILYFYFIQYTQESKQRKFSY